jgi:hypothetical protein
MILIGKLTISARPQTPLTRRSERKPEFPIGIIDPTCCLTMACNDSR